MDRREFNQVALGVFVLCKGQGPVSEESIFLPTDEVLRRLTAHVEKVVKKSDIKYVDGEWLNLRECLDALGQPPPPIRPRVKQWSRSVRRFRFNGGSSGEVVITVRLDNETIVRSIRVPIGDDAEAAAEDDNRFQRRRFRFP
jgi:hypothetical protein